VEVELERLQYLLQLAFSQQAQWLPGENKQLKARAQQSIAIQGFLEPRTTSPIQGARTQSKGPALERNHLNKSQCHAM